MKNQCGWWLGLFLVACSVAPAPLTATLPAVPADFVLKFERGACLGGCSVYQLTIGAAGTVSYEGVLFVTFMGTHTGTLTVNAVQHLSMALDEVNFFAMEDSYRIPATDHPSIIITVTRNGQTKRVWHYGTLTCAGGEYDDRAPRELCELEKQIDAIVHVVQWVKAP